MEREIVTVGEKQQRIFIFVLLVVIGLLLFGKSSFFSVLPNIFYVVVGGGLIVYVLVVNRRVVGVNVWDVAKKIRDGYEFRTKNIFLGDDFESGKLTETEFWFYFPKMGFIVLYDVRNDSVVGKRYMSFGLFESKSQRDKIISEMLREKRLSEKKIQSLEEKGVLVE